MTELTPFEAELDAINEEFIRQQQIRKAEILNSGEQLGYAIANTVKTEREKIMKLLGDVTDCGLEMDNPHHHKDLPEKTKDLVIELAKCVEAAIEDFIDHE